MYVMLDWQETTAELRARYRREPHGPRRLRLHALWLVREARLTLKEIADLLSVNERTIRRWLNRYRTGGLAAVLTGLPGQAGGAVARLTVDEDAVLAAYASAGYFRTAAEARDWVADTYSQRYTVSGMRSHLRRLGIHPKRPRPVHAKADLDAQAAWKKGA